MRKLFVAIGIWTAYGIAVIASIIVLSALMTWAIMGFVVTLQIVLDLRIDYKATASLVFLLWLAAQSVAVTMNLVKSLRSKRNEPQTEPSGQQSPGQKPQGSSSRQSIEALSQGTNQQK